MDHAYGIRDYFDDISHLRLKPEAIVLATATPFRLAASHKEMSRLSSEALV
jgi:hypothetical protein